MKAVKSETLKDLLKSQDSKDKLRTALANLTSGSGSREKSTDIKVNKNKYTISTMSKPSES